MNKVIFVGFETRSRRPTRAIRAMHDMHREAP